MRGLPSEPSFSAVTIFGSSLLQCGHHGAPTITTCGPPPGRTVTVAPVGDCPVIVGSAAPSPLAGWFSSNCRSGLPATVTFPYWIVPALVVPSPLFLLLVFLLPPPLPDATTATSAATPITMTTATPTMKPVGRGWRARATGRLRGGGRRPPVPPGRCRWLTCRSVPSLVLLAPPWARRRGPRRRGRRSRTGPRSR